MSDVLFLCFKVLTTAIILKVAKKDRFSSIPVRDTVKRIIFGQVICTPENCKMLIHKKRCYPFHVRCLISIIFEHDDCIHPVLVILPTSQNFTYSSFSGDLLQKANSTTCNSDTTYKTTLLP